MSKMTVCKTCSKELSKSVKFCPHCGSKNKSGFFKKIFGGLAIIIILLAIISSFGNDKTTKTSQSSSSNTIDIVKTGYLGNYSSVTVGKVLETVFQDCKWDTFDSKGKKIVEVTSEHSMSDKINLKRTIKIQFSINDDNTFNVAHLAVNDTPSDTPYDAKVYIDQIYAAYTIKASDESINIDSSTKNDTLKGTPDAKYKK